MTDMHEITVLFGVTGDTPEDARAYLDEVIGLRMADPEGRIDNAVIVPNADADEDEDTLHCDLCTKAESAADLTPDWNPETGNHLSCEAGNPEGDPTRNGAFG